MISFHEQTATERFVAEALGGDFPFASEFARSLEIFFTDTADETLMALLLVRMLAAAGYAEDARRVSVRYTGQSAVADVFRQPQLPRRALLGLARGVVRPTRIEAMGEWPVWTLDFSRIAADVAACLEFVLMPAVRSMLDEVAPLWDASGGRGGLGLCGAVRRGVERVELDSFCRVWAARTARARNWASAPEIIWLDSTG